MFDIGFEDFKDKMETAQKQMVYVEILYDCGCFTTARTAIISVYEREGYTFISDYFEEAKKKLFAYLFKEYGVENNEVLLYDWKYHGLTLDIIK